MSFSRAADFFYCFGFVDGNKAKRAIDVIFPSEIIMKVIIGQVSHFIGSR